MPLLKTTEQVKLHNSAIEAGMSFESLASYRDEAEDKHLIAAIGRPFYDQLILRVNQSEATTPTPLTAGETEVIRLLVKASANFAIGYYTSFGSVRLSDVGAHVTVSDTQRIASDKKIAALEKKSFLNGYSALYQALEYLHQNKAVTAFSAYFSDSAYTYNASLIIPYPSECRWVNQIKNNAHLFESLIPAQIDVIENSIKPILGDDLYDDLLTAIIAQSLDELQQSLIVKIKPAIAYLMMAEGVQRNILSVDASGVFAVSESTGGITGNFQMRDQPMPRVLQSFMHGFSTKGESELEKLRVWLNANITDFEGYTEQSIAALSPINLNTDANPFFFT